MTAKKRQIGFLGATALAIATAMGGVQQANALVPVEQNVKQQENKEGISVEKKVVKPESERNKHGGFSGIQNPYKHIRKGERNQRQYRKWLRSNPCMRKSRKANQ